MRASSGPSGGSPPLLDYGASSLWDRKRVVRITMAANIFFISQVLFFSVLWLYDRGYWVAPAFLIVSSVMMWLAAHFLTMAESAIVGSRGVEFVRELGRFCRWLAIAGTGLLLFGGTELGDWKDAQSLARGSGGVCITVCVSVLSLRVGDLVMQLRGRVHRFGSIAFATLGLGIGCSMSACIAIWSFLASRYSLSEGPPRPILGMLAISSLALVMWVVWLGVKIGTLNYLVRIGGGRGR